MLPIPRPRSNGVHTVHNARINLLATAVNNLALAFTIAGFVAPLTGGQLLGGGRVPVALGWDRLRDRPTWMWPTRAWRPAAMTWDQVLVWLILPAIGTIVIGGGAVWLSRHIP